MTPEQCELLAKSTTLKILVFMSKNLDQNTKGFYCVGSHPSRKNRNGVPINSVLLDYYQINLNGKKSKVALGAIMHKILNYIFAVLRDKIPFEMRNPKIHKQMFLESKSKNNVA